jgi:hypothetical protein
MGNNKKQTAVEWLIDKVEEHFCLLPVDLIEKAKAMEKEQIIDARDSYVKQMLKVNDDLLIYGESQYKEMTSEQYYNETYGN